MSLHQQRAANDPDYRYLEDQVEMAREARKVSALPLQKSGRLAMRDEQEAKALAIENRRRAAKGQTPLESLISADEGTEGALTLSEEETGASSDDTGQGLEDNREDEPNDVLLLETGRILVDAIATRHDTSVAGRTHNSGNKAL